MFKRRIIILLANITVIFSCCVFALAQISGGNLATDAAVDSVVTILLADNGQANPVGSGLVVTMPSECPFSSNRSPPAAFSVRSN